MVRDLPLFCESARCISPLHPLISSALQIFARVLFGFGRICRTFSEVATQTEHRWPKVLSKNKGDSAKHRNKSRTKSLIRFLGNRKHVEIMEGGPPDDRAAGSTCGGVAVQRFKGREDNGGDPTRVASAGSENGTVFVSQGFTLGDTVDIDASVSHHARARQVRRSKLEHNPLKCSFLCVEFGV